KLPQRVRVRICAAHARSEVRSWKAFFQPEQIEPEVASRLEVPRQAHARVQDLTGRKKQGRVQLLHQGQTGRRRKYCQGLPQLIGLARVEAVRGKVYGILNSIHNAVLGLPAPT